MENHTSTELNENTKKVLVVEDDFMQQAMMCQILGHLNYWVQITGKGLEAVKLTKTNHYDFILMDFSLPDIKGYEVAELIRKNESKHLNIPCPIAILTASIDPEMQKYCFAAGVNWVFEKPLTAEMMAQIEDLLKRV